MDRNLARKNIRSGLIVGAAVPVHVRHDLRRRGDLRLMSPLDPELPPVGEEIHLPGPSLQPFLLARRHRPSRSSVGLTCDIDLRC